MRPESFFFFKPSRLSSLHRWRWWVVLIPGRKKKKKHRRRIHANPSRKKSEWLLNSLCGKRRSGKRWYYIGRQLLRLFPALRTLCKCDNVLSMRDDSTQPTWRNALFLPGSLLTDALQDSWISSKNRAGDLGAVYEERMWYCAWLAGG